MAGIKDRKRTRFNRLGVIRLGTKVFWCKGGSGKDAHKSYPTRWAGEGREACGKCGKVRTGLTDRNTSPFQPGHFVLWDAPEVLAFYRDKGIDETDVREIDIMFPFADRDQNFIASYQVWAGGDCVCQGDGELVDHAIPTKAYQDGRGWHVKKADGETLVANGMACRPFGWNGTDFAEGDHVPCGGSGEEKLYPHCNLCKLNSMLKVMMSDPELFRMGYYRISTGSGRNYDHLDTMFDMLPENVQGIYFQLRLAEEATQYKDKDGKTRKTTKWFLHLEPNPKYMRDLYARRAASQIGQGAAVDAPQLEAGAELPKDLHGIPNGDWYDDSNEDGALAFDDVPFNADPEPEPPKVPVEFKNWTHLKDVAVERLGYSDVAQVEAVLRQIFNGNSQGMMLPGAWTELVAHQESRVSG